MATFIFSTSVGCPWAHTRGGCLQYRICRSPCAASRTLCASNLAFISNWGDLLQISGNESGTGVVSWVPLVLRHAWHYRSTQYGRWVRSCRLCIRVSRFPLVQQRFDRESSCLAVLEIPWEFMRFMPPSEDRRCPQRHGRWLDSIQAGVWFHL